MMQFLKQQDSPKNTEQAVGIPQRKGDAEADIADGVDRERVGDSPHASGEHGPDDEMRSLPEIGAHMRGAANECGNAPPRQKNAEHHDQRDRDRRDIWVDQLDGSLRAPEPCPGGKSAKDAEGLQAAQPSCVNRSLRRAEFRLGC
jgi:hypothetical protein